MALGAQYVGPTPGEMQQNSMAQLQSGLQGLGQAGAAFRNRQQVQQQIDETKRAALENEKLQKRQEAWKQLNEYVTKKGGWEYVTRNVNSYSELAPWASEIVGSEDPAVIGQWIKSVADSMGTASAEQGYAQAAALTGQVAPEVAQETNLAPGFDPNAQYAALKQRAAAPPSSAPTPAPAPAVAPAGQPATSRVLNRGELEAVRRMGLAELQRQDRYIPANPLSKSITEQRAQIAKNAEGAFLKRISSTDPTVKAAAEKELAAAVNAIPQDVLYTLNANSDMPELFTKQAPLPGNTGVGAQASAPAAAPATGATPEAFKQELINNFDALVSSGALPADAKRPTADINPDVLVRNNPNLYKSFVASQSSPAAAAAQAPAAGPSAAGLTTTLPLSEKELAFMRYQEQGESASPADKRQALSYLDDLGATVKKSVIRNWKSAEGSTLRDEALQRAIAVLNTTNEGNPVAQDYRMAGLWTQSLENSNKATQTKLMAAQATAYEAETELNKIKIQMALLAAAKEKDPAISDAAAKLLPEIQKMATDRQGLIDGLKGQLSAGKISAQEYAKAINEFDTEAGKNPYYLQWTKLITNVAGAVTGSDQVATVVQNSYKKKAGGIPGFFGMMDVFSGLTVVPGGANYSTSLGAKPPSFTGSQSAAAAADAYLGP